MIAPMEFGRDAMITATNILKKLGHNHRADSVHLDDRIFRSARF
jgi:hypothetical protein